MKTTTLASALRDITSKMHKRLRRQMNSANNFSISEITTLSHLYQNESLSPSELACLVMVKTQSMSEVLSHLQQMELIIKTPSLTDKRKFNVSLTAHGRQVVEQTRYERDEWLTEAIAHHLSSKEQQVLAEAVSMMERICNFQ